ncbi:MAG: pyridoxamine 5'-phosphate oxidase family protein [Chloroflexota bacterium]
MNIPKAERPFPLEGYGIPESEEGMVDWAYVLKRLHESRNYWVCTMHPNGTPHARPVWGVLVEQLLYVGGGPDTRWARNLMAHPQVGVHLEDGDSGVIIEGAATYITDDESIIEKTDAAYMEKYNIPHGPVWQIHPHKIFAWQDGIKSMTRWRFK